MPARPEAVAAQAGALAGKVVLITGAAGGLGSECALQAAAAGATVVLAGRRVRELERVYDRIVSSGSPEPAIYPINLEGATPAEFAVLAETIDQQCGRLDVLVHAAAAFSGLTPLESLPPEDWLRSLQVNLNAPFVLTQSCLPMLRAVRGSCVFVLDDESRVGNAFWNAYGVAKFALRGLVSQWAQELENAGVRMLAFTPAPMRTTLRARAYFAEDAALLPAADVEAARCLALIAAATSSD
ncbi:MAG: SDR family NAD(P)-dependent oxidoreductase [Xanthomonadales bacterium]|nr:SDR family NAD(P)-dependent oxidoreductase [Xanthomonadales bacterium]MBK7145970.1 SDR family NAD(P)-dependent oxidoreductase [Xanthomonadales bacterium]